MIADVQLLAGDARAVLATLEPASVQACITSPPYWGLRDYGAEGQIGLEATPDEYAAELVDVFEHVARVLRPDGTLWLNLGDSYADRANAGRGQRGSRDRADCMPPKVGLSGDLKAKDLVGIPWLVAFELRRAGWYLRAEVVWSKPNPMPESAADRPTRSHESLFLLSRRQRYYSDFESIAEPITPDAAARAKRSSRYDDPEVRASVPYGSPRPTVRKSRNLERKENHQPVAGSIPWEGVEGQLRNVRSVWEIATQPTPDAHFATYPEELVRRCVLAGSRKGDTVLDPFVGSGTTALVARRFGRNSIGIDVNPAYLELARRRVDTYYKRPFRPAPVDNPALFDTLP